MEKVLKAYGVNKKDLDIVFTHSKIKAFSPLWWLMIGSVVGCIILTSCISVHIMCQLATLVK